MPDSQAPAFPEYFPANCPPASAAEATGECFRIIASDELTEEDFKSYKELGKACTAPDCARCGVSVYTTLEKARFTLRLRPYLGTRIARGNLETHHGKLGSAKTLSGHMEWWPYAGVDRRSCFEEPLS